MKFEELTQLAWNIDAKLYGDIRTEDLFKYLNEEVEELKSASQNLDINYTSYTRLNQIEEFGDVLFCLLALARQKNIAIDQALSLTIIKLQDRLKRKTHV